jgi:hypothetical protein
MAQAVGSFKIARFGQDVLGGHLYGAGDYNGPVSYVQGGDLMSHRMFGLENSIVTLIGSIDQTDTYEAVGRPMQNDVTPWQLVWRVVATGAEVAAGVNLSTYIVRLSAIGV